MEYIQKAGARQADMEKSAANQTLRRGRQAHNFPTRQEWESSLLLFFPV